MNLIRSSLVAMLAITFGGASLFAADPAPGAEKSAAKKTVRVLGIGNSFTHNATTYLGRLAKADGNTLILKMASIGGSPLQLHWEKSQIHQRDPKKREGLYGNGLGLKEILLDGPHDFVTIQQRSISSHDIATYRPYAANLQKYIREHAPEAELLVHQTWAYRVDDRRFAVANPKPGEPRTQREMYEMLSHAYRTIAKELGVRVIPVGDAFQAADSDPQWGYKPDASFDPQEAKPRTLPDQSHSLHAGYHWRTKGEEKPTLGMDGHHASAAGQYLGACVWYEVLFSTSCVGNEFTAGLDADYARFLQTIAHEAVANNK